MLKKEFFNRETEKQFQQKVVKASKIFGWLHYHTFWSKNSPAGFPDLVLVKGDRLLFRELKTEKGRLTPAQKVWGEKLAKAGADYDVWRPSMMTEIYKELR